MLVVMRHDAPEFDPHLIEQYAEQLYRKADAVRVGSAVIGGILGVVFGAVPLSPLGEYLPVPSTFGLATVLIGGLVGAFLGYVIGQGRAFRIRLQAQMVLFQLKLERNTAVPAAPATAQPAAPAAPAHPAEAQPAPAPVAPTPQPLQPVAAPAPPTPPPPLSLSRGRSPSL